MTILSALKPIARATSLALLVGAALSGLALSGAALAKRSAPIALEPSLAQQQAAIWSSRLLPRMHYRAVPLDDAMSAEIYKRMIESYDSEHWFFTANDIKSFDKYKFALDDAINEQELAAPFEIFKLYRQRVQERTAFARNLVKKPFDYTVNERYEFDREKAAWATSSKELDDLWRKRIKNDALRLTLAGKPQAEITKTLDKRYGEFLTRVDELDGDDVFSIFLNAYASSIEPHTNYLSPRASENFDMQMRLSLEGIGAMLQRDGDYTTIASVVKGGPADRQGELKDFDRVVSVGQGESGETTDVVGWRVDDVVELIRGKRNTVVRLEVLGADQSVASKTHIIKITRDKVKLEEQAAKKRVIDYVDGGKTHRIGVIELPGFYLDFAARAKGDPDYRSSTRDVSVLIDELKKENVEALLIDLRDNGGGSLSEATELTGLFIDQGPVVQVRNSQDRVDVYDDPNAGVLWKGPMAVMVNRASASASEIFAAAIQDYGRGLILGETTFGKGTVQQIIELDRVSNTKNGPLGELKMTIQQFFRINGGSTQHKGVVPDIAFPTTIDPKEFGESSYDNALPYTEIPAAKYVGTAPMKRADIATLALRFKTRAATDVEYGFLLEDLAERDKNRLEKSVSLLLSERKTERDTLETKRLARLKARQALGDVKAAEKTGELDDGLDATERRLAERKKREDADDEDRNDPYLNQAARIIGDIVGMANPKTRAAIVAQSASAGRSR
jgi:carboxyl-terminal processing protease